MRRYKARSICELYDRCDFLEWKKLTNVFNYYDILKTAIELYIKFELDLQRCGMWIYAIGKYTLNEIDFQQQHEINKIFELNSINPCKFANSVMNILNKTDPKINALRIYGVPNSGKTLIANLIVEPFICCYMNNHGSENEFYASNMLNKAIILCEELYITVATAEDFKSILGGQPIDVAKKFNEKQLMCRTPVIITSNHAVFGRGHLPPVDENALMIRTITYNFNVPIKPECKITCDQFYHFLFNCA